MLGLEKAMEETGLVKSMVGAFAGSLSVVLLAAIYAIAATATELVMNSAVAILLTPITIGTGDSPGR